MGSFATNITHFPELLPTNISILQCRNSVRGLVRLRCWPFLQTPSHYQLSDRISPSYLLKIYSYLVPIEPHTIISIVTPAKEIIRECDGN